MLCTKFNEPCCTELQECDQCQINIFVNATMKYKKNVFITKRYHFIILLKIQSELYIGSSDIAYSNTCNVLDLNVLFYIKLRVSLIFSLLVHVLTPSL